MKTSMKLILVLLLTFISFSCNQNQQTKLENDNTLKEITKRGEMRVAYLPWSPTVIKNNRSGELTGIYPDMVNLIAKDLKVKVKWYETTLANFISGLNSKQYDFSVGATFITIPRSSSVLFTQPIAYVGNGGVVKANGKFFPKSINDLNKKGLKIAVLQGQAMEEYCRVNFPNAEIILIAGGDLTAPLATVTAGRADIGLMNTVTVAQYALEHKEVKAVLMGEQQIQTLPLAWTTRQGDTELLSFLNSSITYMKSTGKLKEIQNNYPIKLLYDVPKLSEL